MRRGRKTQAALAIVPKIPGHIRPAAPSDLSKAEQEVWKQIVDAMAPNWFGPETWPVLRELCFHVVTAKLVKQRLQKNSNDPKIFRQLILMCRGESKAITELSMRLRITPSTRVNSRQAEREHRHGATKRPWEVITNDTEEETDTWGKEL